MISSLSRLAGLGQVRQIAAASAAVVLFAVGFWLGHQLADGRWQQQRADELQAAIDARDLAQARADDLALQYLQAVNNTRVVYRDVVKQIPVYRDAGECRITDDGVHQLACFLRPSDCAVGTAAADP
jgi:hypothetical protein